MKESAIEDILYSVHRRADGRFVELNRNYVPLGVTSIDLVDYDALPGLDISITAEDAVLMSWNGDRDTKNIFMFNDGCAPWQSDKDWSAYQARRDVYRRLVVDDRMHCPR